MKKLLTLSLAYAMFTTTTAFAFNTNNVNMIVRDYKVDVRVNNTDAKSALEKLTKDLVEKNISTNDLMDYIQSNSTDAEYQDFVSMIELGETQAENIQNVNTEEFNYIMSEVFASSNQNSGANYQGSGCNGRLAIGFGIAAIAVAIILLVRIHRNANDSDSDMNGHWSIFDNTDNGSSSSDTLQRDQIITGVAGAIGILLIVGGSTRC